MYTSNRPSQEIEDSFKNPPGEVTASTMEMKPDVLEALKADILNAVSSHFDIMEGKFNDRYSLLSKEVQTIKSQVTKSSGDTEIRSPQSSYLTELYSNISLPGMRYVASCEPTLHRLLWIFIHTAAFLISYTYIQEAYVDWQSSPIVRSLAITKVEDIPFPGITVCRELTLNNEYNQSEVFERCVSQKKNESRKFRFWTCGEEELKMFTVSSYISRMRFGNNNSDWSIREIMYLNVTEYIKVWKGTEIFEYMGKLDGEKIIQSGFDLDNILENITTTIDFRRMIKCESVIYKGHRLYGEKVKEEAKRVSHSGSKTLCTPERMLENVCKENLFYSSYFPIHFDDIIPNNLYTVCLQNTLNTFSISDSKSDCLAFSEEASLLITPKFRNARNNLAVVDLSKRECIFSYEKKLDHFEFYTQSNCILDCQINCSIAYCGCVTLWISVFNSSLNFCSVTESFQCQSYIGREFSHCSCECPTDCVALNYAVEINEKPAGILFTALSLEYKDAEFISEYIYSATSLAEFLAYSLGILGVFNGFSLMLVWEILYWLTLRLWCHIKRYQHF